MVAGEGITSHKRKAGRMGWVRQGGEGLSTDPTLALEETLDLLRMVKGRVDRSQSNGLVAL